MSTVFYSWQSDLPETRNVIEAALERAIRNLNRDLPAESALELDQDTRGVAGWPEITSALFDKIEECGVFVADITPINGPDSDFRITPNPNVLLELGYALATGFGRTRIICVINTHYLPDGDLGKLPFDLRGSRPVQFALEDPTDRGVESGQEDPTRTRARADLAKRLEGALATVMEALEAERLAAEAEMLDDGLTPESRLVLRGLVEHIGSQDRSAYYVDSDVLEGIGAALDMPERELEKELVRLDKRGYINFEDRRGTLGRCRVGPEGVVLGLKHTNRHEFEAAYKEIAAYVYRAAGLEGNQTSVGKILEGTGHSSLLVNAVLDIWASRDLIQISRTMGGTASDRVFGVSPLLEEEAT